MQQPQTQTPSRRANTGRNKSKQRQSAQQQQKELTASKSTIEQALQEGQAIGPKESRSKDTGTAYNRDELCQGTQETNLNKRNEIHQSRQEGIGLPVIQQVENIFNNKVRELQQQNTQIMQEMQQRMEARIESLLETKLGTVTTIMADIMATKILQSFQGKSNRGRSQNNPNDQQAEINETETIDQRRDTQQGQVTEVTPVKATRSSMTQNTEEMLEALYEIQTTGKSYPDSIHDKIPESVLYPS